MSRLTRDGTAEPVSRDQILRRERGQVNIHVPCSADHEQDWQPYSVEPYSCYVCDHTYMQWHIVLNPQSPYTCAAAFINLYHQSLIRASCNFKVFHRNSNNDNNFTEVWNFSPYNILYI